MASNQIPPVKASRIQDESGKWWTIIELFMEKARLASELADARSKLAANTKACNMSLDKLEGVVDHLAMFPMNVHVPGLTGFDDKRFEQFDSSEIEGWKTRLHLLLKA